MSLALASSNLGVLHPTLVTRQDDFKLFDGLEWNCTFPNSKLTDDLPTCTEIPSHESLVSCVESKDRNDCVDYCNALNDGSLLTSLSDCWSKACTNHADNLEQNNKLLEWIRDNNKKHHCEKWDLRGDDKKTTPTNRTSPEPSATPVPFKCTVREGNVNYVPPGFDVRPPRPPLCVQPELVDPNLKCRAPNGEIAETFERDNCVDICNNVYDGTFERLTWNCWETECSDAATPENKPINDFYIKETQVAPFIAQICKPLGLNGNDVVGGGVKGGNDTAVEKPAPAPVKDDADSAAAGLGLKKGAVVLALVFGSVFSGLLV